MSKLGPLSDIEVLRSPINECLVRTADSLRQLYTDFDLRPYRVFMVWVGWTRDLNGDGIVTAAEREIELDAEGAGRPVLLKEVEILPTPLVQGLAGIGSDLDATGATERGQTTVSQISMGYTEDQLQGLIAGMRDPNFPDTLRPGVTFFYEIQENRPGRFSIPGTAAARQFAPDPLRSPRRRFHLVSAPSRQADAFQWTIALGRADGERGRTGAVEDVSGRPVVVSVSTCDEEDECLP